MSDKTKFAHIVPAMIQDKTSDWLLSKLDDQLSDFSEYVLQGDDAEKAVDGFLNAAAFRGRLIHEAFIAQYADAKENVEGAISPLNIETLED
ncbi:hypothetical protein EYY83_19120 [Hafnia alvei]|uniref:hypothetical protein n=1 Tax=Hafnia alvei TaxID=569 RepID=UPI001033D165|nr:hypothetical protein [Hafnia alvei]TBM10129.1 hypothetical protein EYY83_19120 [Hafnia alvei]